MHLSAGTLNRFRLRSWKSKVPVEIASAQLGAFGCCVSPKALLAMQEERIHDFRKEAGYVGDAFGGLIIEFFSRIAAYAQLLPASDGLHHSEPGGLFRFCLDAAFFSFRQADGRILAPQCSTEDSQQEESVVRYACLVAAALRGLARVLSMITVRGPSGQQWDPCAGSLLNWASDVDVEGAFVAWTSERDALQGAILSSWIARDVIPEAAIERLSGGANQSLRLVIQTIAGAQGGVVSAIADGAFQAAVDRDLQQMGVSPSACDSAQRLIVSVLRTLVRTRWQTNTPGGRLWVTAEGVFLVVPGAIEEVRRSVCDSATRHAHMGVEDILRALVECSVLAFRDGSFVAFTLWVDEPGIPAHGVPVACVPMPYLIGVDAFSVHPIHARLVDDEPSAADALGVDRVSEQTASGSETKAPKVEAAASLEVSPGDAAGTNHEAMAPHEAATTQAEASETNPDTGSATGASPERLVHDRDPSDDTADALITTTTEPPSQGQDQGVALEETAEEPPAQRHPKAATQALLPAAASGGEEIPPPAGGGSSEPAKPVNDSSVGHCAKEASAGAAEVQLKALAGRLERFEWVGQCIHTLATRYLHGEHELLFIRDDAVCVPYPGALKTLSIDPQQFLTGAQANLLITKRPNSPDGFIWRDGDRGGYLVMNKHISCLLRGLIE